MSSRAADLDDPESHEGSRLISQITTVKSSLFFLDFRPSFFIGILGMVRELKEAADRKKASFFALPQTAYTPSNVTKVVLHIDI